MPARPSVAVIGCGQWGRNHVRTLAELGALAAVGDRNADKARAMAERHGARAMAFEATLADPAIEAIVLALPAEANAALACAALQAGKHVLAEKPIALTAADAEAMIDAARAADRVLMVGHVLRYHTAFEALMAEIAAGRIGAVRHVQSHRLGFGKFYDRFDALWDLAPHDLSLVLPLLGAGEPEVRLHTASVTGVQTDLAHIHLTGRAGVTAHVFVSRHSAYAERRFVVTGQTGALVWDDLADWPGKVRLVPHAVGRSDEGTWHWEQGEARPVAVEPGMALTRELTHFLDCIAGAAQPMTPGAQGLAVLRILNAGATGHKAQ